MWFLKFLLILVIVYLLGYLFLRVIFPWLLKKMVKKFAKKMDIQFEEPQKRKKQGSINIDYVPENQNPDNSADDKGEYIDFEEIK